jgi:hypothetical protein
LPHRVGCALEPVRIIGRLLGGKNVNETAAEHVELVSLDDVLVEGCRVELGQDKDAVDVRVEAVADRDIDDPILASQWNCRFAAQLCQRIESLTATTAQHQCEHILHDPPPGIFRL